MQRLLCLFAGSSFALRGGAARRVPAIHLPHIVSVRAIAGTLLLVAATLKAEQRAYQPALFYAEHHIMTRWWSSRLLLTVGSVLPEIEAFLGFWLLSSRFVAAAEFAGLLFFVAGSAWNLWAIHAGIASCGCLGLLRLRPWVTFVVDAVLSIALYASRRRATQEMLQRSPGATPFLTRWFIGSAALLVCAWSLFFFGPLQFSVIAVLGASGKHPRLLVLDPADWVGTTFPLTNYLDEGGRLATGSWDLLFYRANCASCNELLAELRMSSSANHFLDSVHPNSRIVMIDVEPTSSFDTATPLDEVESASLDASVVWAAPTPLIVRLNHGLVTTVVSGDEPIAA